MPFDFFLGYIKDAVYVPALSTTFSEFAGRICIAAVTVTSAMLTDVWTELEWCYVICTDTDSGLTEHL